MNNYTKARGELCFKNSFESSKSKNLTPVYSQLDKFKSTICYLLLITPFLVSMFSLSAQTSRKNSGADGQTEVNSLEVGDPIPAELWNLSLSVVNNPTGKKDIKLADFKNKKLIILDFWATWCSPCIKMLPKLEEFRGKYGNDLVLLAISDESKEKIQTFANRNNNPVFTVYGNQTLKKYFPHRFLPHSIWIADGKLLLSNSSDYITDGNIQKAIQRKDIDEFKTPPLIDYNENLSLKDVNPSRTIVAYGKNRAFYNFFNWRIGLLSYGKSYFRYFNGAIQDMLYEAFSRDIPHYGRLNRFVFDIPDSLKGRFCFDYDKYTGMSIAQREKWNYKWKQDNFYSYEFINMDSTSDVDPKTIFREDLRSFLLDRFAVYFSLKPVLRKQYLITIPPSEKILDSENIKTENFFDPNTQKARFVNIRLENILSIIAEQNKRNPIPITWDKKNTNQLYSIKFDCSLQDLPNVFMTLKKHGIEVQQVEHPLLSILVTQAGQKRKEEHNEN